ncbi:MAG: DUF6922 domain-containing protein [Akkermansiaceae bacterium]
MNVDELSPHLFWDVDHRSIHLEKNARWLIQRVLEYGKWKDWNQVEKFYGREHIRDLVTKMRSLRPKCRAFCQARYNLNPEDFRCFEKTAFQKT